MTSASGHRDTDNGEFTSVTRFPAWQQRGDTPTESGSMCCDGTPPKMTAGPNPKFRSESVRHALK